MHPGIVADTSETSAFAVDSNVSRLSLALVCVQVPVAVEASPSQVVQLGTGLGDVARCGRPDLPQ